MFHYLTEGVQEPFMKPELADRLAAMLGTQIDRWFLVSIDTWRFNFIYIQT